MANLREHSATPSPRQISEAFSSLAKTAQMLLQLNPDMPEEDRQLYQDMLEAESAGDPFATLDRLVQAAELAEHYAEGVRIYRTELALRLERHNKNAEQLHKLVRQMLEDLQLKTLIRPTYSASLSNGPARVVPTMPAEQLPPRFQRITIEANKEALRAALKANEKDVPAHWSNPEPVLTIRTR